MRQRLMKTIVALVLVLALSGTVSLASAPEPYPGPEVTAGMMFFDLAIARPLGLFAMIFGTLATGISLPFTLPTGSADETAQKLIVEPTSYTFKRPLGQF